jgi:hypothetical protein
LAQRHDVPSSRSQPHSVRDPLHALSGQTWVSALSKLEALRERGLAKAPVTVWVYEGSLKVEYQAVTLSKYSVQLQEDRKHVREVSHPRLADTPFRSPQLELFESSSERVAALLENP